MDPETISVSCSSLCDPEEEADEEELAEGSSYYWSPAAKYSSDFLFDLWAQLDTRCCTIEKEPPDNPDEVATADAAASTTSVKSVSPLTTEEEESSASVRPCSTSSSPSRSSLDSERNEPEGVAASRGTPESGLGHSTSHSDPDPPNPDYSEGISEGSLACVAAINDTLMSTYRLSYFPPLARKTFMFWTEQDFEFTKEFVRLFPAAYPSITKLEMADNSNPEYSKEKHTELEAEYKNSFLFPRNNKPEEPDPPSVSDQQFRSGPEEMKPDDKREKHAASTSSGCPPLMPVPPVSRARRLHNSFPLHSPEIQQNCPSYYPKQIPTVIHPVILQPSEPSFHQQFQPHQRGPILQLPCWSKPVHVQSSCFISRSTYIQPYHDYPPPLLRTNEQYWNLKRVYIRQQQEAAITMINCNAVYHQHLRLRKRMSYFNYLRQQSQPNHEPTCAIEGEPKRNKFSSRRRHLKNGKKVKSPESSSVSEESTESPKRVPRKDKRGREWDRKNKKING